MWMLKLHNMVALDANRFVRGCLLGRERLIMRVKGCEKKKKPFTHSIIYNSITYIQTMKGEGFSGKILSHYAFFLISSW